MRTLVLGVGLSLGLLACGGSPKPAAQAPAAAASPAAQPNAHTPSGGLGQPPCAEVDAAPPCPPTDPCGQLPR
ncbi:MAG: hypothetical protein AABZ30_05925 [Myxococcota bacterium]